MKLRVLSIVVVIIFTLLLTWCQNKFIISEVGDVDISSENKINGIINDNRVPVVIISNTNSWDIITQSWNEYWNLITNKNWGKKWEIDNWSPEPNEIENSNDNIEQIIQEIWNKIKELELLFENLKNMVHSTTK